MNHDYKRLPGRYWNGFYSGSLWLGNDHILAAFTKFFSVEYKRFYFRDIQRITVRKNKSDMIWKAVWGGSALIAAQFLLAGWSPVPLIISGFFLFLLLINWLRGPKCWCHIHTAVQTEKLPTLHHWRTALKTLNKIRPLIEKKQGELPIEVPESNQ